MGMNATTDDPQRPYVLFKFAIQKTTEKLPEEEKLEHVDRGNPQSYQPFNDFGYFAQYDVSHVQQNRKDLGLQELPPLGYDMSRSVVFYEERKKELQRFKLKRSQNKRARMDDLKHVKIAKAFYVRVKQYSPE